MVKSCSARKISKVLRIGLVTLSLVNGDTSTAHLFHYFNQDWCKKDL